jgi:hypothetical protein
VLDAYQQLIPGAYRADLWRYCVLYIHGGFYADAKMQLHVPLTDLLPKDTQCLLIRDRYRKKRQGHDAYIYQAMMAFCPRHPVLKNTIEQIVAHVNEGYYGYDPLDITGPSLLGKVVNRSLGRAEKTTLNPQDYRHPAGSYTILPTHDKPGSILCQNTTIYPGYYEERTQNESNSGYRLDKDYAACWFRHEVFRHGRVAPKPPSSFYLRRYRHFWARQICIFYKHNQIAQARESFRLACAKGAISFRLVSKLISYEIQHAALMFFKQIKQILNKFA